MVDKKIIVLPLFKNEGMTDALHFAQHVAVRRGAMLKLIHLSEHEESPDLLIARLGLKPENLFNTVITHAQSQEQDYERVLLEIAAKPEVDMLILSLDMTVANNENLASNIIKQATCPIIVKQPSSLNPTTDRPLKNILVPLDGTQR